MRKLSVILMSFLFIASTAYADTVSGKIQNASPTALNVTVYDNEGRPFPTPLYVKVNKRVKLKGADSLSDLMAGDEVKVEVKQNRDGSWQAKKIERAVTPQFQRNGFVQNTELQQQQQPVAYRQYAQPAAPNPIMDMLRSPQAKNAAKGGVMGAVVGGVASGTSGGKTGKGALIGAGAGAAASLIGDALSRPAQTQAPAPVRRIYDQNGNLVEEQVR